MLIFLPYFQRYDNLVGDVFSGLWQCSIWGLKMLHAGIGDAPSGDWWCSIRGLMMLHLGIGLWRLMYLKERTIATKLEFTKKQFMFKALTLLKHWRLHRSTLCWHLKCLVRHKTVCVRNGDMWIINWLNN